MVVIQDLLLPARVPSSMPTGWSHWPSLITAAAAEPVRMIVSRQLGMAKGNAAGSSGSSSGSGGCTAPETAAAIAVVSAAGTAVMMMTTRTA